MTDTTLYDKQARPLETFLMAVIYGAASISVLLLMGIVGYVFFKGFRVISWNFLTTVTSALKKTVGIAGNIVNTLYIVALTLFTAIPVGVGAAIYLNEYARPGRLTELIEFTTETLSGIPSIIFGLFGIFIAQYLCYGLSDSLWVVVTAMVLLKGPLASVVRRGVVGLAQSGAFGGCAFAGNRHRVAYRAYPHFYGYF